MQEDIDFETWYTDDLASEMWSDHNGDEIVRIAWEAGRQSNANEIERLRRQLDEHHRLCREKVEVLEQEVVGKLDEARAALRFYAELDWKVNTEAGQEPALRALSRLEP